jgi:hypothetical protein
MIEWWLRLDTNNRTAACQVDIDSHEYPEEKLIFLLE